MPTGDDGSVVATTKVGLELVTNNVFAFKVLMALNKPKMSSVESLASWVVA